MGANKKITELNTSGALGGTEELPIVQGGTTVKTTINAIATFFGFVKKGTITNNTILKGSGTDTATDSGITDDGTTVLIDRNTTISANKIVNIGSTTTVGIPNNTCDFNISHNISSIDYVSLWNNNNGDGMLFIEENAIGYPMSSKNGTLISAKLHLFSGGGFVKDIQIDGNDGQILFNGTKGWINSTGWLRLQGGNSVFDISGYEGQDLRIGTDGDGTSGKGIYLKAYGNSNWRTGLKYLNNGASEPILYLQPDAGNVNLPQLTPSQIVETDASKNLVSAAKGTAYNKNFGTTAGTVLEGSFFPQRETMVDANKTFSSGKTEVYLSASLTAPRVLTLPAASAFTAGTELIFVDEAGAISSTNYVTLTRVGSDLINGASTAVFSVPYATYRFTTDGSSKWTLNNITPITSGTYVPTVTGYSGTPTISTAYYTLSDKQCTVNFSVSGTSNATTLTATLPFNASSDISRQICLGTNNTSTNVVGLVSTRSLSNVADCYSAVSGVGWTSSGTKVFWLTLTYTIQ